MFDCCLELLIACSLFLQVVGVTYRSRYYFIWAMSRAAMAVAGLDFIKWDEEKQRGAWGRCCNAYPLTVELADSGRLMGNNWNITTATFMRRCMVMCIRLCMYNQLPLFFACTSALDGAIFTQP